MREIKVPLYPIPKDRVLPLLQGSQISLNDYARQYIRHDCFCPEQAQGQMRAVLCSLRQLGLPQGGTLEQIFAKVRQAGLRPCRPSAGLFLRLAYQDQPPSANNALTGADRSPEGAITALSEPLEQDDRFPKGLYLRNVQGVLWLRGYLCDQLHQWSPEDIFALEQR